MATWGSEGIVLKRSDFGEADKLITFLTKHKGKVVALAKGVRRIKSRRAGNIELLNHSKLFFSESKKFKILTEAVTIRSYQDLKNNLNKISYGYKVAEIVDRLISEDQEARLCYDLLIQALEDINNAESLNQAQVFARAFEIKLLDSAGFRPQLSVCVRCSQPLIEETQRLSASHGGILDSGCSSGDLFTRPISVEAIKILRFLQDEDWSNIRKLSLPTTLLREINQHLSFYLEYVLETDLRSSKFVERVENL